MKTCPWLLALVLAPACEGPPGSGKDTASWLPPPERTLELADGWSMEVACRDPGADWAVAETQPEARVPSIYYPDFSSAAREVALTYTRALALPEGWADALSAGFTVLLESDGADYGATVSLDGVLQGAHEGYLGRWAVPLLGVADGSSLEISLLDLREDTSSTDPEDLARTTLQGMDTTGWGINVSGLPEALRLRLVGPAHLRNLFAAPLDADTLRVGADVVWLDDATGWLAWALVDPSTETVVAAGDLDLGSGPLLADVAVDVDALPRAPLEIRAEVLVGASGAPVVSDQRESPVLARRFLRDGAGFTLDGAPLYLAGLGVYTTSRLLDYAGSSDPIVRYQDDAAWYAAEAARVAADLRALDANAVRPAHHVPRRAFHAAMAEAGVLVLQDFPLHWNTDFAVLSPAAIAAQFEEFLWRVAAEPAVVMISLHNEAEINDMAELATNHALLEDLLARAREVAPHLVVVGASGCAGTSNFSTLSDTAAWETWRLDDDVIDRHKYLSSIWQPDTGVRQVAEEVASLDVSDGQPVLWSELAGGWGTHFDWLLALDDTIPDDATRAEIEAWLVFAGRSLTVPQFYAALHCFYGLGVDLGDVEACVLATLEVATDAQLIAVAKDHFFGDRLRLVSDWDASSAAAWLWSDLLARQLMEARAIHLAGGAIAGSIPWDAGQHMGLPSVPAVADGAYSHLARPLIASAYATRTVFARPHEPGGDLELALLNGGEQAVVDLVISGDAGEVQRIELNLEARSVQWSTVPWSQLQAVAGQTLTVAVEEGGEVQGSYQVLPVGG